MANITVSATSNFDDYANLALANGDDITIDTNAVLTVNSDNRWGQNGAVIGNVTITAATGGELKIDGTTVWWLPFDTSSGAHHLALTGAVKDEGGAQVVQTTAANDATANDMILMRAAPATNDAYYYGYAGGKFSTLWVNIGTNGVGTWVLTWEYWNGASWSAITGVSDGTTNYTAGTGWKSVKFAPPSNWATSSVQSISAYWIRARISSYTSKTTAPIGTQARIDVLGLTIAGAGGASGECLGIWTALGTAPVDPSNSTATGFIKLRSKSGSFADNDALSFYGSAYNSALVNSSTGGQRGWLNFTTEEIMNLTVPRLGTFRVTGDWFELGTTSGSNGQTFQYPVADFCPAMWVETGPGTGVYEPWIENQTRWNTATKTLATDARGKYFTCTSGGVITIALSGANACGYLPPSGCKVRVPNIHQSCSVTANWATNLAPNATLASRWETAVSGGGVILIDKMNAPEFYLNILQAYQCQVKYSGFYTTISISEVATQVVLEGVVVSPYAGVDAVAAILFTLTAGGNVDGCRFNRYDSSVAGDFAVTLNDLSGGWTWDDCIFEIGTSAVGTATRGNAGACSLNSTNLINHTFTNCSWIGSRALFTTCSGITITNPKYADIAIGTSSSTTPVTAFLFAGKSNQIVVSGFGNFADIANVHPYTGMFSIDACDYVKVRNIGTWASPYNMGTALACGLLATFVGKSSNIKFQRIYTVNARTGLVSMNNSDNIVLFENVFGDYADTFTELGLNAQVKGCGFTNITAGQTAIYGHHFEDIFTDATTSGRFVIVCNEKTAVEPSNSSYVIEVGTPKFTSVGTLAMVTLNDQLYWETPYWIKGHEAFANALPTITGTNVAGGTPPVFGNFTFYFQIDKGSGWSGWTNMTQANLAATTGITPTTGFKLRVRAKCTTAAATNVLTFFRINTVTSAAEQQIQYPLDTYILTLTGFQSGSDIVVYQAGTTTIRSSADAVSSFTYEYETPEAIDIGVFKAGYVPFYIRNYTLLSANASLPIAQVVDRAYLV